MGAVKAHRAVKLIAAIAISEMQVWPEIRAELEARLGHIEASIDWFAFTHTDYYEAEMGAGLQKCFLAFQDLIAPAALPEIKLFSNVLEQQFAAGGRRRVNIDPGYLTAAKLILATTKDYSHRIYLDDGIYGDLHLQYRGGRFQTMPWTYPDYQEAFVQAFLTETRSAYMRRLAEG